MALDQCEQLGDTRYREKLSLIKHRRNRVRPREAHGRQEIVAAVKIAIVDHPLLSGSSLRRHAMQKPPGIHPSRAPIIQTKNHLIELWHVPTYGAIDASHVEA